VTLTIILMWATLCVGGLTGYLFGLAMGRQQGADRIVDEMMAAERRAQDERAWGRWGHRPIDRRPS
jgi:hypothetical protein